MKRLKLLLMAGAILVQACNSTKDVVADPWEQVPATVLKSFKEKYPTATDIKFSVLEESRIYKADFKVDGTRMSVVTNQSDILNSVKAVGGSMGDSLQNKLEGLSIQHGKFSNYRIVEAPDKPVRHMADYALNGVDYNLTVNASGDIDMTTRQTISRPTSFRDKSRCCAPCLPCRY